MAVEDDGVCDGEHGERGDDDVRSHLEKWLDIKLYHVTVSFNR